MNVYIRHQRVAIADLPTTSRLTAALDAMRAWVVVAQRTDRARSRSSSAPRGPTDDTLRGIATGGTRRPVISGETIPYLRDGSPVGAVDTAGMAEATARADARHEMRRLPCVSPTRPRLHRARDRVSCW
jgi:hypothetical protein